MSALTRAVLIDLHTWWFRQCPKSPDSGIPQEVFKSWFMSSAETDNHCQTNYANAAQAALGMSVADIRRVAQEPLEEVAAVILLDQIPRNVFRGMEARKAYTEYDPLAQSLAKALLADGYGTKAKFPLFAHSMFLYLPLMHSENLADHDLSLSILRHRQAECVTDEERAAADMLIGFETKHRNVVEEFGRYPSRNEALGRTNTDAESKHLKDGPGW